MKGMVVITVLLTLGWITLDYRKKRNFKKTLIALGSFAIVISFVIAGNLTRPVVPLYIAHLLLVIIGWGALLFYLWKEKYLWWLVFSPLLTIVLFLLLEFLTGSGHELPVLG